MFVNVGNNFVLVVFSVLIATSMICNGVEDHSHSKQIRILECSKSLEGESLQQCIGNVLQCYKGAELSMPPRERLFKETLIPAFVKCSSEQGDHIAKIVAKACVASHYYPNECGDRTIVNRAILEMTSTVTSTGNAFNDQSPQIKLSKLGNMFFSLIPRAMDILPQAEEMTEKIHNIWTKQKQKSQFCSKEDQSCDYETTEEDSEDSSEKEIQVTDAFSKQTMKKCPEDPQEPVPLSSEGRDSSQLPIMNFVKTTASQVMHLLTYDGTKEANSTIFRRHLQSMLSNCQLTRLHCCILPKTEYIIDPKDLKSFNTKLFTYKIFNGLKSDLRNAFMQAVINFKVPDSCDIFDLETKLADDCVDYMHIKYRIYT